MGWQLSWNSLSVQTAPSNQFSYKTKDHMTCWVWLALTVLMKPQWVTNCFYFAVETQTNLVFQRKHNLFSPKKLRQLFLLVEQTNFSGSCQTLSGARYSYQKLGINKKIFNTGQKNDSIVGYAYKKASVCYYLLFYILVVSTAPNCAVIAC